MRDGGGTVHISKTADYALRAVLELASTEGTPLTAEQIAHAQDIPWKFLQNILLDLKHGDIVVTQRGAGGGYRLARSAELITLADVVRAVDGPLVQIQGRRPEDVEYCGNARALQNIWIAARASLRGVLEAVTVADALRGDLPSEVQRLVEQPDAWIRR